MLSNQLVTNELQKYSDLINSIALQRLKNISFLGAIDYNSKKRQTRYSHTISVARLAVLYSYYGQLTSNERKHLIIAALLHDIGHPPFSHSAEKFFIEEHEIDHHLSAIKIIKGESPLGSEVNILLRKKKIDIEWIIAIIRGEEKKTQPGIAFSSPINIDTIDAVTRTARYYQNVVMDPETVLISLLKKEVENLDKFWILKNKIYTDFIFIKENIIKDFINKLFIKLSIRTHKFTSNNFLFDNEIKYIESFRKFEKEFMLGLHNDLLDSTSFKAHSRIYYINKHVKSLKSIKDFYKRYKLSKNYFSINAKDLYNFYKIKYVRPI